MCLGGGGGGGGGRITDLRSVNKLVFGQVTIRYLYFNPEGYIDTVHWTGRSELAQ